MKAMVVKKGWVSSILEQREVKMPEIKDNEVIIEVCACGVNRGDIIDVVTGEDGVCPGLECSGIIEAVGRNVDCWRVGERIRDGTSGIGALAIQYAKLMGFTVFASTGSNDEFSLCRDYGADFCVDRTSTEYTREDLTRTDLDVDFVLDYGASDLERNIECCCAGGKVFIVDLSGMVSHGIDLGMLQKRQAEIKVFDLRSRDLGCKASVIAQVRSHLWPAVLEKKVIPAVGSRFAVTEAQKALNRLKENDKIGKIIVYMNFEKTSRHLKME